MPAGYMGGLSTVESILHSWSITLERDRGAAHHDAVVDVAGWTGEKVPLVGRPQLRGSCTKACTWNPVAARRCLAVLVSTVK